MQQNRDFDPSDQELISQMLQNESIEKAMQEYQKDNNDVDNLSNLFISIAERARANAGFIVSVDSNDIPSGADSLKIFTGDNKQQLLFVENTVGQKLAMAFTSVEKYQSCSDTSAIIMFIDDFLYAVNSIEGFAGIVINLDNEQVFLDKNSIRMLLSLINKMEERKITYTTEIM